MVEMPLSSGDALWHYNSAFASPTAVYSTSYFSRSRCLESITNLLSGEVVAKTWVS